MSQNRMSGQSDFAVHGGMLDMQIEQYQSSVPGVNCLTLVLTQAGQHVESHIWFWESNRHSKLGELVTEAAMSKAFHMDLTAAARVCAAILSLVS